MCRAVWVVIAAASDDEARAVRRHAGADVQPIALCTSAAEARAALEGPSDVLVVTADADGARDLVAGAGDRAVVWIGADAPDGTHAVVEGLAVEDALAGAITRALIARNARR